MTHQFSGMMLVWHFRPCEYASRRTRSSIIILQVAPCLSGPEIDRVRYSRVQTKTRESLNVSALLRRVYEDYPPDVPALAKERKYAELRDGRKREALATASRPLCGHLGKIMIETISTAAN